MGFRNQGFEVILASTSEYEELTAEIYFDGRFVALVSCDSGLEQLEIEFPGIDLVEDQIIRKVDLRGFLECVELACKRLRREV